MSFVERYDFLIAQIEDLVKNQEEQILERLSATSGTHIRLIADAFQFITGMTLSQYIKRRRLINAIHFKNETDCSLENAAIKYSFPDLATMSKAFKNCFGISPSQVNKEELAKHVPLTMERLMLGVDSFPMAKAEEKPAPTEIFGIEGQRYREIKEALELSYVYGLSDEEAEFAYALSQKREISLSRAFELVDGFVSQDCYPMEQKEFADFLGKLREYLEAEKVFVENPSKMIALQRAFDILEELFPEWEKGIEPSPLQTGAVVLFVEGGDILVRGTEELALFSEFCSLVDNYEIYPRNSETIRFAAVMHGVYTYIGTNQ